MAGGNGAVATCARFPRRKWPVGHAAATAARAALGLQVGSVPVAALRARAQRWRGLCPGWPVLLSRRARWRPAPCEPRIRCVGRTVEPSEISERRRATAVVLPEIFLHFSI